MKTAIAQTISALTLTAALIGASSSALADERTSAGTGEPSIKIEFADLNLNLSEDVAELYARIKSAARLVCVDSSSPWDAKRVESF